MNSKKHILFLVVFIPLLVVAQRPAPKRNNVNNQREEGSQQSGGSRTIVDDSTKLLYGPNTIRKNIERDIIFKLDTGHFADTSVLYYHEEYYPMQKEKYHYQNLGMIGTPMRPFFPEAPKIIGRRLGVNISDWFFVDEDEIDYYITKSPYSYFGTMWGGNGRTITQAAYTRNINPRWNFGGEFKGYYIDKELQRSRRGDRLANIVNYHLHSNYISENGKYKVFANLRRSKHNFTEQGIITPFADNDLFLLFQQTASPSLNTARSSNFRRTFHGLQQYTLAQGFSLFHQVDFTTRISEYREERSESSDLFALDARVFESGVNELTDQQKMNALTNKVGISGAAVGLFYSAYLQRRDVWLDYTWHSDQYLIPQKEVEYYLGFEGGYQLRELIRLEFDGLLMNNGSYRMEGHLDSKWIEARINQSSYMPSLRSQAYLGLHHFWLQRFENTRTESIEGKLKLETKKFKIYPKARIQNSFNQVYYENSTGQLDELFVEPVQTNGNNGYFMGGLESKIKLGGFMLDTEILNNQTFGPFQDIIAIPEWLFNASISYHTFLFDNNLELHTGLQFHWKSDYFGMGYDPGIQQFFPQNTFEIYDYWHSSVFANIKVRSGRIFARFNNLRQTINPTGYFAAPYYRGMPSVFDFGFNFSFYD